MRKIFFPFVSAVVLASCGANQKQAVEYNNNLVLIQEVATEATKFGQPAEAADSAEAHNVLADLSTYIDKKQEKAEALKFDGDDSGMKAALMDGFVF